MMLRVCALRVCCGGIPRGRFALLNAQSSHRSMTALCFADVYVLHADEPGSNISQAVVVGTSLVWEEGLSL